ncbi:MAG: M56 family metallopeptidase [Ilumatobacteraceae bacterium]
MIDFVAFPLVVTVLVAVVGSRLFDRLRPDVAARAGAALLAAVSVASVPTLWIVGLSGLTHMGLENPIVDWSRHVLPEHRPFGAVVGAASLVAAVIGTCRVASVVLHHRRLRCTTACPLELVDTDEVYAYTLPGPAGIIAISTGLRDALDDDEFDVVLAHEQTHARHRHDRFKLLGLLTAALMPPVRSVVTRLDYHLERWADEEALDRTGIGRRVGARTIAKVALADPAPAPALGIANHGVAARAAALLSPPTGSGATTMIETVLVVTTALLLATFQLHHTLMFAAALLH